MAKGAIEEVKKGSKRPAVESSSEDEAPVKKPAAKVARKAAVPASSDSDDAPPVKKAPVKKAKKAESSSEDEAPKKKASPKAAPKKKVVAKDDSDSDSDAAPKKKASPKAAPKKKVVAKDSDSDSDVAPKKKASPKAAPKKAVAKDSDSDSDAAPKKKASPKAAPKKKVAKDSDSESEEEAPKKKVAAKAVEEEDEDAGDEEFEVFVGGLPWDTTEEALTAKFEGQCGPLTSVRMLTDRDTGSFKGIAFIKVASKKALNKALELNEADFGGRWMRVNEANGGGKGDKGGDKGKSGKGDKGKGKGESGNTVFVGMLPYDVEDHTVQSHFEGMGAIVSCRVPSDWETGQKKGFAFIEFEDAASAKKAIDELNESELGGKYIVVKAQGAPKGDKGKGDKGKSGKGDKGKGKGKGKGKPDARTSANRGGMVASEGKATSFDSDSD